MTFIHLQVKSGYSILKSVVKIEELVNKAKELGFRSLALTDESVLHGVIPFYKACLKAGIKPIIGMTIEVAKDERPPAKCVLLAENKAGYRNLMRLSTFLKQNELSVLPSSQLNSYTSGLIGIMSASAFLTPEQITTGEWNKESFTYWKSLFSENALYMGAELSNWKQTAHVSELLSAINKDYIPVAALGDVRYIMEEDRLAYECLEAIRAGTTYEAEEQSYQKSRYHFLTSEEVEDLLPAELMDFSSNTEAIAERCRVEIDLESRMLPSYPVPSGEKAKTYLQNLCEKALNKKFPHPSTEARKRMDFELAVIEEMGFSDYFLIVWDFIDFAKKEGIIVGPGRGSAAGSLIAFLLNITNVDPLKYGLLFERFLNPERISLPDIDIDFSDHRREEVIQYVMGKYGSDHVAQIITFGTFATKSLLRELIKTLNIDPEDAAFVMRELAGQTSKSISEAVKGSPELIEYTKQSRKLKALFKAAAKLEGLPRHVSTHAAGVVISEQPLVDYVPLTKGNEGVPLTQFAMNELEAVGLLKMDFLGLRNLTLIERIISSINYSEKSKLTLTDIPLEDEKAFRLLRAGKTNGIFQLESQGMQSVLKRLRPTEFEDVVAVNALYRPGPMEYIPVYVERKHGRETVSYPHPDLKPILEKTYGVLVYQEQIMQIASNMAGFSLGQADILRRAVSKKQTDLMQEQKEKFIQGCLAKGYEKPVAEEMFHWIVRFSDYGFNRSHAVAYSMISFQLAFLKAHFPSYFLAELMSSVSGNHEKIQVYMKEAKEFGLAILLPSVNKSYGRFSVEKEAIRFGLSSIKGVGNQAVKAVLEERKKNGIYKDLFDFCLRLPGRIINRPVIEALVLAGAFDSTNQNRAALLATIDQALEQGELFSEFDDQPSFFSKEIELDAEYVEVEEFSPIKKLELEKQVLGLYLSSHPLTDYRERLQASGYIPLVQAQQKRQKKQLKIAASVQEIKKVRTKRGESMAFLKLGDETTQAEAVLFPDVFRETQQWIEEEMFVLIHGKLDERNGKLQWIVEDIFPLKEQKLSQPSEGRLFIQLKGKEHPQVLKQLKQAAEKYSGSVPVILHQADTKKTYQLSSEYWLDGSNESISEAKRCFGKENVVYKKKGSER